MARKPTMTDIAAACGVSQATVSLVLNGAPGARISAATRAAVSAKAQELGYARGDVIPMDEVLARFPEIPLMTVADYVQRVLGS